MTQKSDTMYICLYSDIYTFKNQFPIFHSSYKRITNIFKRITFSLNGFVFGTPKLVTKFCYWIQVQNYPGVIFFGVLLLKNVNSTKMSRIINYITVTWPSSKILLLECDEEHILKKNNCRTLSVFRDWTTGSISCFSMCFPKSLMYFIYV